VISGKTDPANPLFTRGGSFWTNDSIPLLELPPDQDPRHHPLNQCMHYGYASMALVPIRDKEEVVGLIHINDHRKGRFSIADIQQLEGIAAHIGEALVRKRSEEHVRGLLEESDRARLVLLGILDDETRVRADFRRLAMAIDQTTEAVMVTDTHGLIQYVNPAFEVVTGYTLSEVVGQNPRILKSGQHSAAFYHEMWGTISSGNVWKGRLLNRKKNGAIYTEEATIAPVRDGAGGITNYVSVRRDITENLSMHAQLEQSQKMESVGRLAGGVAHDFNNILQSILGTVQLAIEQPGIIQQARLDLEEIQSSARRAAALTRQLLAFASKQVIAPQNIDLNKLIPGMLSMLNRIIGENINLVWTPGDGLWPVWVDPSQIDQILANLLVNARDAIEDVGAVHITTENVCVDEITALQHEGFTAGDYVLLMVSDTGHGMDAATLARIFEPFFTTKEVGKGTGLGLATVYGIVRQNKGRVAVYSEPGKGTTFRIYLQRYSGTANTPVDLPDPKVVRGSETILLVEDDTSILNMVERTLRGLGYNVLAAATPQVALRTADEYAGEIQLLLTDVIMPGMNGNELAKQITARRSNLHCIFMSGFPAELIAKQGVLVEGVKFLQKPFVLEKLAAKIREALAEATPA
ncbi:MAG: ATP-binding protein, partial [bacterium]